MIAALYVARNGSYIGIPGVDPWPIERDARLYLGPHPVVAHPPCQRWGKFWAGQPLHIKRTGERKIKGNDGGCFKSALAAVRAYGGVLEHPRDSHAWAHFNLNEPPREGDWIAADMLGGWTCCIEQGRYGHYARKATWLYAFGCELPDLDWGKSETRLDPAIVARMGFKRAQRLGEVGGRGGGKDSAPRIGTPIPFRDLLLAIARSAKPVSVPKAEQLLLAAHKAEIDRLRKMQNELGHCERDRGWQSGRISGLALAINILTGRNTSALSSQDRGADGTV